MVCWQRQARPGQHNRVIGKMLPAQGTTTPSPVRAPSRRPVEMLPPCFFSLRSYGDVSIWFKDDLSFCSCVACIGCSIIYGKNSLPCDSASFMQPTVLKCSCLSVCLHSLEVHVQFLVANLHSIMFNYKCISLVAWMMSLFQISSISFGKPL